MAAGYLFSRRHKLSFLRMLDFVAPAAPLGYTFGRPGLYLMGYSLVRFGIEFFRQPDPHLMYIPGPFTMGQLLCAAMILLGLAAFVVGRRAALQQTTSS